MAKRGKPKQLVLKLNTWGGKREGAGRPPAGDRTKVSHVVRTFEKAAHPVHITLRMREDVASLRQAAPWAAIVAVMKALRERSDFRVVHYSVLRNHLHLVVEADDKAAFIAGMKALLCRLALRLNAVFGRKGRLFAGRYHSHVLTNPHEVRNAILYVLLNAKKHAAESGLRPAPQWIDPYSSAAACTAWCRPIAAPSIDVGTSPAQTRLLREGWRKAGPLDPHMIPGGDPTPRRRVHKAA